MINLIKNELFKIFHKFSIYFFIVLTLIWVIISTIVSYSMDPVNNMGSTKKNIKKWEENAERVKDVPSSYADLSFKVELEKLKFKYPKTAPEIYFIENKIRPITENYVMTYNGENEEDYDEIDENYNEFDENYDEVDENIRNEESSVDSFNLEELEDIKNLYDEYVKKLDNFDWKELITQQIENKTFELKRLNDNSKKTDEEKNKIILLEEEIKILNYRLDNGVYFSDYTKSSADLDEYIRLFKEKLEGVQFDSEYMKKNNEKEFNILKYKIENNLIKSTKEYDTDLNVSEILKNSVANLNIFFIVVSIVISCQIVSSEFEKGTIKKLLTKPYKRSKILSSKIIASIIAFLCYVVFYMLIITILTGIFGGFSNLLKPQLEYNFNTSTVFEINIFADIIIHFIAILPMYLFTILFTICVSIVTKLTSISMALGVIIHLFAFLTKTVDIKFLILLPTTSWDFNSYLFGGVSENPNLTLLVSIFVQIISFAIVLFISYISFKYKEIKNQ